MKPSFLLLSLLGILHLNTAALAQQQTSKKSDSAATVSATDANTLPLAEESTCDTLGKLLKLYKAPADSKSIIRDFNLQLSMQYQWGWTDPHGNTVKTQGGSRQDEWKLFRLGFNTKLFSDKLKFTYVWNMGGLDSRYVFTGNDRERTQTVANLYLANFEYTTEPTTITFGLMTAPVTTEYRTSSTAIITIERSILVNQLRPESNFGLQFKNSNKDDKWGWCTGLYLNGVEGGDRYDEPDFSSRNNAFLLLSASYDTAGIIMEKGRLWLDYTRSFADDTKRKSTKDITSSYRGPGARDVFALSWEMNQGDWSCLTEVLLGLNVNNTPTFNDYSGQDVWGFIWMPSYKITPSWEAVLRYQFARGNDAVRSEPRYIASGSRSSTTNAAAFADQLHALYLGINYYICPNNPHNMKIMAGMEYSDYHNEHGINADRLGFTGWSYYVSLRSNF